MTKTLKDPDFKKLKDCALNGWPDDKRKIDPTVKPYYNFQGEITVYENVLYKGVRIIVPISLPDKMRIHHGHLGIEKCKARARSTLYWPDSFTDSLWSSINCIGESGN